MSHEIVYTSAPKGLKDGSRGFCTVISSSGMARNLAERLEALSGYRHVYDAHDPKASLNPVNYSHLVMVVGGQTFHVLSRICDAGLDYTQRSNKLAHHVAFESREVNASPGGSPAWTMMSPGFCEETWDGNSRLVSPGRKKLPKEAFRGGPCEEWKRLTGDAGWAGILAQSALAKTSRPMHIIFMPGTDTLRLVAEALHLLPPEKRWDVSFSTYFTRLPAGTECQWRFLLDGTPEAEAVRRDPHMPKIDLCSSLGEAPAGALVSFARTGIDPRRPPPVSKPPRVPVLVGRQEEVLRETEELPPALVGDASGPGYYELEQSIDSTAPDRRSALPVAAEHDPRIRFPWITCVVVSFVVLIGLAVVILFAPNQNETITMARPSEPVAFANKAEPGATQVELLDVDETANEEAELASEATSSDTGGKDSGSPTRPSFSPAAERAPPMASIEPQASISSRPDPEDNSVEPLADVLKRGEQLELPTTRADLSTVGTPLQTGEFAKIFVPDPTMVVLTILGSEVVLPAGVKFEIYHKDTKTEEGPERTWKVFEESSTGLGQRNEIGTFRLKNDHRLMFAWSRAPASKRLQYSVLQIKVKGESARCTLSKPKVVPVIQFDSESHVLLDADPESLPPTNHLQLDLELGGFQSSRCRPVRTTLLPGSETFIKFDESATNREPMDALVEVRSRLVADNGSINIQFSSHASVNRAIPKDPRQQWPDIDFRVEGIELRANFDNEKQRANKMSGTFGRKLKELDIGKSMLEETLHDSPPESLAAAQASKNLEQLASLQPQYEKAQDIWTETPNRLDRISALYSEIKDNAYMHVSLYVQIEDRKVEILSTRAGDRIDLDANGGNSR